VAELAYGQGDRAAAPAKSISDGDLPVRVEQVFEGLTFDRPVIVTHAGDGSGRIFVVGQRGTVHVLTGSDDNDPKVFFNIREKVRYLDRENEEGFLGLAFHPKYKENGQFFIYYTSREIQPGGAHLSVISRMRVSPEDPNKADVASEEVLMTIEQPFWNHNGGTIVFGPDGYLYIGLGDGGAANDPHGNGQNLGTLLGSILRIDVDSRDEGLAYGIPDDNPFVGVEGARPEIYAYGIRNVWRIAFDRETGKLWAGDVGQDLWEEIDIIVKGGNYGWNLREGMHPFKGGAEASDAFVEPIFEYHHDVGKSITGGHVYRGQNVPALVGKYVYADYVTGDIWALDYDEATGQVRGNYSIPWEKLPVMTFGEDEQGELYFTITSGHVYRFAPAE
jgi:quinoprotein glucose dehydrogenase